MKHAIALALCLASCTPIVSTPAPLDRTVIDEKAVILAASTVDALALSASALVKAGVIQPGTPRALSLATTLDTARDAINAAEIARQAGSATDYLTAITRAQTAVGQIQTLIGS